MKLAVGIPTYGHHSLEQFNVALFNIMQAPSLTEISDFLRISDSLVTRARNNIAHAFLKRTKADALLFIDSDIIMTPDHVRRVIDHNKPICCGAYALKKLGAPSWVASGFDGVVADPVTGLQRVRESGTGFMLIQREVFENMIVAYPEIEYLDKERTEAGEGDTHHDFFSVGVVEKRYLSEDWYFCHRAREMGYDIYLDTKIVLGHVGLTTFPIDYGTAKMPENKNRETE